ncbi:MAG: hypothetical protein LUI60_01420 [Clostridia bacterium]|nr:hypothetical protein [Clostridia bacterium]
MKNYVYMVEFDWSTEDGNSDIEIQLYQNYSDALARFKEIITNELNPDMSWIAYTAFDKDSNVKIGYMFDSSTDTEGEKNLWWYVIDKKDYNFHSIINLKKIEIL